MADYQISKGYIPGCIGRIAEMHGTYYHEHWGFGPFFEAKVARELGEFIARFHAHRDAFWTVNTKQGIQGSISIDGLHTEQEGAHLRWFIISDALRGKGAGSLLIRTALDFCRRKKYDRVYLWTFEGLDAARHLYEKMGFKRVEERRGNQWGSEVIEQKYVLQIDS